MTRPLTREELDDIESNCSTAGVRLGPVTLARFVAQCRRAIEFESRLVQLKSAHSDWVQNLETLTKHQEQEIEQLRREKATNDRLETFLSAAPGRKVMAYEDEHGEFRVHLVDIGELAGTGPTYESALKAALDKLETPNG